MSRSDVGPWLSSGLLTSEAIVMHYHGDTPVVCRVVAYCTSECDGTHPTAFECPRCLALYSHTMTEQQLARVGQVLDIEAVSG
jgi:hypothetical protein